MIQTTDKILIIDDHVFTRAEAQRLMEIIERDFLNEL